MLSPQCIVRAHLTALVLASRRLGASVPHIGTRVNGAETGGYVLRPHSAEYRAHLWIVRACSCQILKPCHSLVPLDCDSKLTSLLHCYTTHSPHRNHNYVRNHNLQPTDLRLRRRPQGLRAHAFVRRRNRCFSQLPPSPSITLAIQPEQPHGLANRAPPRPHVPSGEHEPGSERATGLSKPD